MNLSIVTKEIFGQNEMDIYQNESNEIFMTREQIGQALEYKSPRKAISDIHKRNFKRLNKFSAVSNLRTTDNKVYETIIYNEKGIYEIIRKSGQSKADEFYDWVYDLLSKLRKGELKIEEPKSNLEALQLTVQELTSQDKRIANLEENMRINSGQEFHLNRIGKRKVLDSLGGYGSPAYKEMSGKVFARFWRDFKQHFVIPRYSDLPKVKFEEGVSFIRAWQPDTSTRLEIQSINNQQVMRGVI